MKKPIMWIIVGVILIGVSFYAGTKYGGSKTPAAGAFSARFAGGVGTTTARGARGGANGGLVSGSVIAKDDKSITIGLSSGGSQIVFYSASTAVMKTTSSSPTDIAVGTQVSVTGTANSDGTLSAQSVQIRPAGQTPPRATPAQ